MKTGLIFPPGLFAPYRRSRIHNRIRRAIWEYDWGRQHRNGFRFARRDGVARLRFQVRYVDAWQQENE